MNTVMAQSLLRSFAGLRSKAEQPSTATPVVKTNPRGVLLRASASRFGDRVFLCREGHRHWVMEYQWLAENDFDWPNDVHEVPGPVLEAFQVGRNASRRWSAEHRSVPRPANLLQMREIVVSGLSGRGVEFGAGAGPMPVPLECHVTYADVFTAEELQRNVYVGQVEADFVIPDILCSFENLEGLEWHSLDFIVASHVIEHTVDPIGTIIRSAELLKPGGSIALAIPDMTRTFDKDRPPTSLEHIIADFREPSRERDKENFKEYYTYSLPQTPDIFEEVWQRNWLSRARIHYHCWTDQTFMAMIDWIQSEHKVFRDVWFHNAKSLVDANEFYCVLTLA